MPHKVFTNEREQNAGTNKTCGVKKRISDRSIKYDSDTAGEIGGGLPGRAGGASQKGGKAAAGGAFCHTISFHCKTLLRRQKKAGNICGLYGGCEGGGRAGCLSEAAGKERADTACGGETVSVSHSGKGCVV